MSKVEEYDEKALAELSPQAAMRLAHAGQWVAWTEDYGQVVAFGDSRDVVRSAARSAGVDHPIFEWIPPTLTKRTGAGE
jgi:hypothetical protein